MGNIVALTSTVVAMTVKMHSLNTDFSTTWFLAPYCAWLGYGEYAPDVADFSDLFEWRLCLFEQVGNKQANGADDSDKLKRA